MLNKTLLLLFCHLVPINYGEYDVGRRVRREERGTATVLEFYKTIVNTTREEGMSTSVWDDRGWFGLIIDSGN